MSTRVTIRFIKRHSWYRPVGFRVFHDEGWYLGDDMEVLNGLPIRLWRYEWEKAGFGHGRFGYGSFGWAQGGVTIGGFGFGRFGSGEFGYYNEEAEWTTAKSYKDGYHTFGVQLMASNNQMDYVFLDQTMLIISTPADPRGLELVSMESGQATLRWVGSADL